MSLGSAYAGRPRFSSEVSMGKERFERILRRQNTDPPGLWLGNPTGTMLEKLLAYYSVSDRLSLAVRTGEDLFFLPADPYIRIPHGALFTVEPTHVLADCETLADLSDYHDWPDPCVIDLEAYELEIDRAHANGLAVAGGMWSCFFHNVAALFGMENYFVLMHTAPDVVHAVTKRVIDWLLDANARIYARLAGKLDAFFMGNDFGTQQGLLISPAAWRTFVAPYYAQLINQAKDAGLPCMVHSCGAIRAIIPDLIGLGVDGLHPLQALAAGMDAESLACYKGDFAFIGGIDTQRLLPFGSPEEVERDVLRVYEQFGTNWIVSPSHEGYQEDVPAENIDAIVRAVHRIQQRQ